MDDSRSSGRWSVQQLRTVTDSDVRELARTLADAFMDDPVFGWLLPDAESRWSRLRRFYTIELRHIALRRGSAVTSEQLDGASIVAPPGAWRMPPAAVLAQGPVFGRRTIRAARLLSVMEHKHLREPHHYFAHIGVHPQAQGRGLGSRLMRPTLDRCDADGVAAYLEASSERSAALYERLGFSLLSELRVAGSPPLWLMRRAPQSPSA